MVLPAAIRGKRFAKHVETLVHLLLVERKISEVLMILSFFVDSDHFRNY